jgi:cyclopropane-fatty-acyl-phospholipid synthase
MDLIALATSAVERLPLPDSVTLAGVRYLCGRTQKKLEKLPDVETAFAATMGAYPIAIHTEDANAQHYEVPAAFFDMCLGPRRKYSCCLYNTPETTIEQAEEAALAATAEHAKLEDGQEILELGCGWGSLSLYMAKRYPNAKITAVSNSHSQRHHIMKLAKAQGSANLEVITCDMNDFATDLRFDRVVSVEMFEHMSNWEELLTRVRGWLKPEGFLFIHIFTHDKASYRFDHEDKSDWIAQHFFTGGIMPSHGLIRHFPTLFEVDEEWRWNGENYARTAFDWLDRFDRNIKEIRKILTRTYGDDARLWERRWRLFFLATAGLFGFDGGKPWEVSHYRLKPVA